MKHALTIVAALALWQGAAQAHALRDPFARPAAPPRAAAPDTQAQAPQPAPQLRALMVTPGRALANINGQILAVGEWFGDYQLIKVEERGVTLSKRGVKSVLVLDEASRK
jgi:hypothetical protein